VRKALYRRDDAPNRALRGRGRLHIFLDELGELPLKCRKVAARVAGKASRAARQPRTIKVNVRVIGAAIVTCARRCAKAASGRSLLPAHVFPMRVPALRERTTISVARVGLLDESSPAWARRLPGCPAKPWKCSSAISGPATVSRIAERDRAQHHSSLQVKRFECHCWTKHLRKRCSLDTLADSEREHITKALEKTEWRIKGPKAPPHCWGSSPPPSYKKEAGNPRPSAEGNATG